MKDWVAGIALALTVLSFALFAASVIVPLLRTGGGGAPPLQDGAAGFASTAEALAKLVDSLSKAGPAVLCLVASFVFVVVAHLAAG